MVIKRVNPISAGKVSGLLGALLGLVIGGFLSLIGLTFGSLASAAGGDSGGTFAGMLFGVGAIVILPIFYGIIMFIGGLLQAALYNVAAGMTGGIEIDVS
jgi:hypothetical protein